MIEEVEFGLNISGEDKNFKQHVHTPDGREPQADLDHNHSPPDVDFCVMADVIRKVWGHQGVNNALAYERCHGGYTLIEHGMKFMEGSTGERRGVYGLPLTIQVADQ